LANVNIHRHNAVPSVTNKVPYHRSVDDIADRNAPGNALSIMSAFGSGMNQFGGTPTTTKKKDNASNNDAIVLAEAARQQQLSALGMLTASQPVFDGGGRAPGASNDQNAPSV